MIKKSLLVNYPKVQKLHKFTKKYKKLRIAHMFILSQDNSLWE